MFRALLPIVLALFFACDSPSAPTDAAPAPRRPNIVLIVADDLGWSDLGCYGNPFFESPHLDRLAADGVRFTRAYAAGHVCSPTRASILTGRYPARIGLTNYLYGTKTVADSPVLPAPFTDRLPLSEVTIAEGMKKAGYRTGLIGKWHLGENTSLGESDPDLQGFDVTESWDYGLLFTDRGYEWFHAGDSTDAYRLPELTEEITAGAEDFITSHRDTNFFLTVAHYAVHLPLQGVGALVAKYTGKPNPRPEDYHPVYAAMIEQLDESVGRIRAALERQGIADNTLILFVSDNGGLAIGEAGDKPTVNDPLRAGKGTMYEGGIRVPMIAYWPGKWTGGRINKSIVSTVDVFPTLFEILNEPLPADRPIDGRTVLAAFGSDTTLLPDRDLFWHYPHFSNQGGRPRSAIRRGDVKLIESLEDGSVQLFDLARDPGETNDLTDERPGLVAELRQSLHRWRQETGARLPVPK
jgi:arylsulfatase A-like enzyme